MPVSNFHDTSLDWMHPDELDMHSETAIKSMVSTDNFVVNHGKVRTGKTRSNLHKQIYLHFKHYGMNSAIVRATNVDLNASIRNDLREISRYDLTDPRSPIRSFGGKNFTSLSINGGECRLGGMNNPRHILGTGYSLINISQLDELDEDNYLMLATRLSETKARNSDGSYLRQIIADMNPQIPDFWVYKYENEQRLNLFEFDFHDNPSFYRSGLWTKSGAEYVELLDKSMPPGLMRDRYFLGLRVLGTGAVFQLHDSHFINEGELPDLSGYHKYIAIDWGWTAPSVVLWIAWNHTLNDIIVYREWRTNAEDYISVGHQINAINQIFNETIEDYIVDNDKNSVAMLRKHCGIKAKPVQKFQGSRLVGYNYIHNSLANTLTGTPGGIRFYRGMLYRSDVDTRLYTGAENLIKELYAVKFSENKIDEIEKESDHGADALAYMFLFKMGSKRRKIDMGKAYGF